MKIFLVVDLAAVENYKHGFTLKPGRTSNTSKESFLLNGAAAIRNFAAVAVPPVNETIGTSGCFTIASPAEWPYPNTKFTTPSGIPERCQTSVNQSVILERSGVVFSTRTQQLRVKVTLFKKLLPTCGIRINRLIPSRRWRETHRLAIWCGLTRCVCETPCPWHGCPL